ncbi:MAG: methyltransferase domain-containing protein [Brachybacterium tyrofermentans]|uniref:Methyltransferase domain-containing protein n=1 Tax=Brachybacterium tyrofermentans TaxID=47848 RepID=A0ABW0FKK7_9MICO|nr:class I SAM-dependent methyltransferase [Brachybacterium tyrofermentans]
MKDTPGRITASPRRNETSVKSRTAGLGVEGIGIPSCAAGACWPSSVRPTIRPGRIAERVRPPIETDRSPRSRRSSAACTTSALRLPVLDAGCGTGAVTQQLVERGHDVVGIDGSEAMLTRARRTSGSCTRGRPTPRTPPKPARAPWSRGTSSSSRSSETGAEGGHGRSAMAP